MPAATPSSLTARHRRSLGVVLACVLGVVLAACDGAGSAQDDAGEASPTIQTPTTTPTETPPAATPTPTEPTEPTERTPTAQPSPTMEDASLDASCTLQAAGQEGLPVVGLQHPSGWERGAGAVGQCRFFDPEPVDVPEAGEAYDVDVRWDIEPVEYARAAEPGPATDEEDRLPTVVDGRQAVRVSGTSTGEAGLPEGIETTTWIVDLDLPGEETGGTLVGQAAGVDGVDYDLAVGTLDAMARRVQVGPDGEGQPPIVTVARWAGGGMPFTVAYDREEGCLSLYAGVRQGPMVAEACDLTDPDPLTATVLEDGDLQVAAGLTTGAVDAVRLRSNTDARRGAATVEVGDGLRAYAMPLSGTEASLRAGTFDGEQLGEVDVLPQRP